MASNSGEVRAKHFDTLWARQNGRCWICGGGMAHGIEGNFSATIDHVIPKAHGGTNKRSNLKLAHRLCNQKRGAPLPKHVTVAPTKPTASEVIAAAYARQKGRC